MTRAFLTPQSTALLVFSLLPVLLLGVLAALPSLRDFRVLTGHDFLPIEMPYNAATVPDAPDHVFEGKIDYLPFQPSTFRIKADNCLRALAVNDIDIPLKDNYTGALCDFANGIVIDLKPYLRRGTNKVRAVTWDDQIGRYTFSIEVAF